MKPRKLKVAVTSLADFACRTGNLEFGGMVGPSAQEGIRAHQRFQKTKDAQNEVRLKTRVESVDHSLTLSGRVDLLDKQRHTISEIKTNYVPADKVSDAQKTLHWAQVKLYGFCYWRNLHASVLEACEAAELTQLPDLVHLEIIYINLRDGTETILSDACTGAELEEFALGAIRKYCYWQDVVWASREATIKTATTLSFPHTQFRAGQRDMAAAVFRASRDKQTLLCEAPTGIGKTISALFPILKSIADRQIKHALYLTAKTSGRASTMHSLKLLTDQGLSLSSVVIRSKSLTCFCSNGTCERDTDGTCPMTIGFFDRLPAAREEAFVRGVVDASTLDEIAWQHRLCPFEFALQLLPWVSVAVCDYNYVYDPLVRLGRFNEPRKDTTILIDEAHNLLDRSRSMHSGALLKSECEHCSKTAKSQHPMLSKALNSLGNALLKQAKGQTDTVSVQLEKPEKLLASAGKTLEVLLEVMAEPSVLPDSFFELFKSICRFLAIGDLYSSAHRTLTVINSSGRRKEVEVQLKCIDSARYMEPQYAKYNSTVLFSATLRPSVFYRDALGLPEQSVQLQLESPFNPKNAAMLMLPFINTRYAQRQASSHTLIQVLFEMVSAKPGNYMVFFPSYAYMDQLFSIFTREYPELDCWIQPKHSSVEEREGILNTLATEGTRLGFAILGGVFGEGVDYVGQLLIGVAIVGVGLPGIGAEQDLIAEQYQSNGFNGYDYAYRYPGLTRVLQTAGRVIRTESDCGVVLLIDDRFDQAFYRALYPDHWDLKAVKSIERLNARLNEFWKERENAVLLE